MSVVISVHKEYLDKGGSLAKTQDLIKREKISKNNELNCAKKIYAYAVTYYTALYFIQQYKILFRYILINSHFVTLDNKKPTLFEKIIYNLVWIFPWNKYKLIKLKEI